MMVRAAEVGERPRILTPARQNAPQAARAMAELMSRDDMNFADAFILLLDWDATVLRAGWEEGHPGMPYEGPQYPVMYLKFIKHFPEFQQRLEIESRLDVDDVFGNDIIGSKELVDVIESMKEKLLSSVAEKERN